MESKIDVNRILGSDDPVTVWNAQSLSLRRRQSAQTFQLLSDALDELGRRSKVAQGLAAVLTSTQKLSDFPEHRVYLYAHGREFIGILKVGTKKLFIRQRSGALVEMEPLCVLDFYVHENYQRHGIGRQLFDAMLERERRDPALFGYDRPSPKLIGFLRKHFGLAEFVPQTNNFVVFDKYFEAQRNGSSSNGAAAATATAAARSNGSSSSMTTMTTFAASKIDPRAGPAPQPMGRQALPPQQEAAAPVAMTVREQLKPFDPPRANSSAAMPGAAAATVASSSSAAAAVGVSKAKAGNAFELQNDGRAGSNSRPAPFTSAQSYGRHATLGLTPASNGRGASQQPVPRSLAPMPEPAPNQQQQQQQQQQSLYEAALRGAHQLNGSVAKRSISSGRFF